MEGPIEEKSHFPVPSVTILFKTSAHLKVHESTHTGEKPFACYMRNNAFINTARLKVHERTHTGEKPFTCSKCNKAFQQNCDIKKHERTTQERTH